MLCDFAFNTFRLVEKHGKTSFDHHLRYIKIKEFLLSVAWIVANVLLRVCIRLDRYAKERHWLQCERTELHTKVARYMIFE